MINFMSLLPPPTSRKNSGFSSGLSRLDDSWLTAAGSGLPPNQDSKKKNKINQKLQVKPNPNPEHKINSNFPAAPAARGITLIEVLIVVAILAFLLVVIYFAANQQLFRARDGRRKADLNELSVILEDFYNNNGCYPRPTEICYDAFDADDDDINPCYICGREADPLPNYRLPCNPDHPQKKYLYEVEDSECPQWYRIYTELSHTDDSGPCPYGLCGPEGGYDHGVSSPNVGLEAADDDLFGWRKGGPSNDCWRCGDLERCVGRLNDGVISGIHPSRSICCSENNYQPNNCRHIGWDGANCIVCKGTLTECSVILQQLYTTMDACCEAHDCD